MVAIELGMWRSVRSGGAAGSVTVGNGKVFEQPGGTSSTGGNRLPLGDQEAVGRDAQRRMVMKATPSAALEMAQPNLLLELLIIALDAPAQFGDVDQAIEGYGVWSVASQYLVGSASPFGHSISSHSGACGSRRCSS